jgi:hypothetical protein
MWNNGTSSGSPYSREQYSNGPPPIFITSRICDQRKLQKRGGEYGGQSICQIFSRTFSPRESTRP